MSVGQIGVRPSALPLAVFQRAFHPVPKERYRPSRVRVERAVDLVQADRQRPHRLLDYALELLLVRFVEERLYLVALSVLLAGLMLPSLSQIRGDADGAE